MKKTNILYWVFTGLFSFVMVGSSIPDIMMVDMAKQGFSEMGMPTYLLPFVGVAKVLGVIAILIPGYPRLKEWAYAGLIYDLAGATYGVIAIGKSMENWIPMLVFIAIGMLSYVFYHKRAAARKTAAV